MGLFSEYKKKKEREQIHKRYIEKYAQYLLVENDIESMMDQIPPDYAGVLRKLKGIENIPYSDMNMVALCYMEAPAHEGGDYKKALSIVEPEYETSQKYNTDSSYGVELVLYEWIMAWTKSGNAKYEHFKKGSELSVPSYEPGYFQVLPKLCRAGLAGCYYKGEGVDKDTEKAKSICRDIIENNLIPKGYKAYQFVERLLNEIEQQEERIRAEQEEKLQRVKEEERLKEEQEKTQRKIEEEKYKLYNEKIRENVIGLLQEDPPRYKEAKELLDDFENILPDEGRLFLAISILNEIEGSKEYTQEQKEAENNRFINLIKSIETESASLWYCRSFAITVYLTSDCLERGAWCEKETNIFDKKLRTECLKMYAESLIHSAQNDGTDLNKIKEGAGKKLYEEMKRIACALTDISCTDELELWNKVRRDGYMEVYACCVISALAEQLCQNSSVSARRSLLLEKFSIQELRDYGYFNFNGVGKNPRIGYYFYDALISDKEKAASNLCDKEIALCLNSLISYCMSNDNISDALGYGQYALDIRCLVPSEFSHVFAWMMSCNNGYFLTDDRPDEEGRYTDNDRIRADAFRASVIYDGVLG